MSHRGVTVELRDVSKSYRRGPEQIRVLDHVDLTIEAGERIAILGPSGAGKSTFLHLLGMLDRPTEGGIFYDSKDVYRMPAATRHQMRNRTVGFVFQAHHLLPEHSALSNVMIPVRIGGGTTEQAKVRATQLLNAVGLAPRLNHRPGELSGGEQQRVALARALVMAPGLVLADEPTGNLDPTTAGGVFDLMHELNRQLGSTLVVVTHSHELAKRFPRRLVLQDGKFRDA